MVTLTNTVNLTLSFDKLILKNDEFKIVYEYYPGKAITLKPEESYFYNFTGQIKAFPDNRYSVTIKPCFMDVRAKISENQSNVYQFCAQSEYNIPILPYAKITCNSSDECNSNEACTFFACKTPYCNENETIINHECAALTCGFFTYSKAGNCEPNQTKIITSSLLLVFVLVIIYYMFRIANLKNGNPSYQKSAKKSKKIKHK